jgi:choline dehydrogenase-like flavoprotein
VAILDLEKSETPTDFNCEFVIIGAGAVGITLATELARKGRDVILLEAGGLSLEAQSQKILRNVRSTGFPLDGLHSGRFRLLGGTTNFWGGQLVPFDPIVFNDRPWINSRGWPVTRADMQPYYDRAMSLVGMDDCEADDPDVYRRAKTSLPDVGEELEIFLTRWAKVPNFARLFKQDLASANLKVVIHANVVGFEADGSGRRIARTHVRTFGGRQAVVSAKHTILACGTIEIARLLMLPYVDGSTTPWNHNPWLGQAYIDHLDSTAGEVTPIRPNAFHDVFDNMFFDGFKFNPKIKLTERAQMQHRLVGVAGSFIYRNSYQENADNIKLFLRAIRDGRWPTNFLKLPGHALALSRIALPFALRYLRSNRTFHATDSAVLFRVTCEQIPQANSKISLRPEQDELGVPMVDVGWTIDQSELNTIAYFAEQVQAAFKTSGLADIHIDPRLAARDPSYLKDASDTYHQMGGARMGYDATDGTVDKDLAVFGISDLYVAGAAVFPSTGFANCTLTAIALGLRLSDHLTLAQSAAPTASSLDLRAFEHRAYATN